MKGVDYFMSSARYFTNKIKNCVFKYKTNKNVPHRTCSLKT